MSNIIFFFWLFAKISFFTFGGGYAMVPLFQSELVYRYGLMTNELFANMVALAQVTPGPIGLNAATYLGFQQHGVIGALAASAGAIAPSVVLTMIAAAFLAAFKENKYVQAILRGIRPATVGLIAAAVIFFAEISVFTAPIRKLVSMPVSDWFCWQACVLFAVVLTVQLIWKKINVFALLMGAIALGLGLFYLSDLLQTA